MRSVSIPTPSDGPSWLSTCGSSPKMSPGVLHSSSLSFAHEDMVMSPNPMQRRPVLSSRTSAVSFDRSRAPSMSMSLMTSQSQLFTYFELTKELGCGAYGIVMEGVSKLDGQRYAIKLIPFFEDSEIDLIDDDNKSQAIHANEAFREVSSMAKMEANPFVVRYYSAWIEDLSDEVWEYVQKVGVLQCEEELDSIDGKESETFMPNRVLVITMEVCDDGTLKTYLDARTVVDETESRDIFLTIVQGLRHIHAHRLLHRDMKPENILLSQNRSTKLIDFGLATAVHQRGHIAQDGHQDVELNSDETLTSGLGSPTYAAPEQLEMSSWGSYDQSVDIYPLGLILLELLSLFSTDMERLIAFQNLKKQRKLPQGFEDEHPRMAQLILDCTSEDPGERPDIEQIWSLLKEEREPRMSREDADEIIQRKNQQIENLKHRISQLEMVIKSQQ